jgi:hypothetical protein
VQPTLYDHHQALGLQGKNVLVAGSTVLLDGGTRLAEQIRHRSHQGRPLGSWVPAMAWA